MIDKQKAIAALEAYRAKFRGLYASVVDACIRIIREMPDDDRWIPVEERMPELIPCSAGTGYSEAVIVWTSGRKAMIAVYDGTDFLCAASYWDAEGETITHWKPLGKLPEPPKEG